MSDYEVPSGGSATGEKSSGSEVEITVRVRVVNEGLLRKGQRGGVARSVEGLAMDVLLTDVDPLRTGLQFVSASTGPVSQTMAGKSGPVPDQDVRREPAGQAGREASFLEGRAMRREDPQ